MALTTENEAYTDLLCSHLQAMVWRLRKLPAEAKFNLESDRRATLDGDQTATRLPIDVHR